MARQYTTVADELLEHADVVVDYFISRGHRVRVERYELGFPFTATFLCRRGNTTLILELDNAIQKKKLDDWVRYAKSSGKDTRLALCMPSAVNVTAEEEAYLRANRVGLYSVSLDPRVDERIAPDDLGLNVALPELGELPANLRGLLGPAYDQFARAQWREGFEDACQVLEVEARRYLKKWARTRRITVLRRGIPVALSDREINKMTMGKLAVIFAAIQSPNHADSMIGRALTTINKDRVGVAHHKARKTTERRLRVNVGQHMWTIVAALKLMN